MEATIVERPDMIHAEVSELAMVGDAAGANRYSTGVRSEPCAAGRTCHRVSAADTVSSTTAVSSAATLGKANDGNRCERKKQKRQ